MARHLRCEDYNVGWVCALPIELTAAQVMLDEEHQDLPRDDEDANIYTLGRIGQHNIVLACLPAGQTGNNSAAVVAVQMRSTFPIRFGLMVGIGGGVPSIESDIRLGDIVVSQPTKDHSGIIQYDFGKSTPSGFERTGFLNNPPQILLSAISKLRANQDRGKGNFIQHLAKITKLPKFGYDKVGRDVLFEGDYNHHTRQDNCTSCDNTRMLQREERIEGIPEIHYGTIASGNSVIRDGRTRDQISSELGGVLCFEMEAAGLVNNFPCLVIRGICDYADSHKNKRWQPYAAGTAAAFAKELLLMIPAADVRRTRGVGELTRESPATAPDAHPGHFLYPSLLLSHQKIIQDFVASSRAMIVGEDELRSNILQWLSSVDCAQDLAREGHRRAPGTGDWLFELESFRSWYKSSPSPILWISGPPGSGKTVLGANIIQTLQQQSSAVKPLLFFLGDKFDDQKRSLIPVLATFLTHIMAQTENIPLELVKAFEASRRYGRPQLSESDSPETLLMQIVGSMLSIDIVLDGLDEFHDTSRLLSLLKRLSLCNNKTHIVVLSRDYPKIRHGLTSALHVDLVQSPVRRDIEAYIRLSINGELINDHDIRENIVRNLLDRADDSFLWASLVLEDIVAATSIAHIEQIMVTLPKGLEAAYAEIFHMLSLKGTHSLNLSRATFLWICCSWRYLNWAELQCALANAISGKPHSSDHLPFKHAVLEACGSLVRYEAEQDMLRPVHLSVREYLMNCTQENPMSLPYQFQEPDAHGELAKQCLEYLERVPLPVGKWNSAEFPMLSYATHFWCRHTISSTYNIKLHKLVLSFLSNFEKRASWHMNMVFWGMNSFPIRGLVRMQAQLSEWTSQSGSNFTMSLIDTGLDWTIDIMNLLLHVNQWKESSYFVKAMHMRDLARSLTLDGQLSKAVANVEMELSRENEEGEKRRDTWLLNFLGVLYDQQGKVKSSLETQQRALEIQESHFGVTHSESLWTVNEIGRVFRHLGRFEESEVMHRRVLQALPNIESNDMEIAWTKSTLSRTYRKQGRFQEALNLSKEAFETNANLYGEDHPQCLWILNDIGQCYRFQAIYEKAEQVFRQAWEKRAIVLGAEHTDTLWSANNLGILLLEIGKQKEAMNIQTMTLEIQERVLGPQHQFTVWTRDIVKKIADSLSVLDTCKK